MSTKKRKKQTNRAITRRFNRKVRKLTPYAKLKEDYEALRTASDMQDGDIEHLQSRIRDYERIIAAKDNPIWKTGRGESIPVAQLEEGHLRNAISYCTRRLLGSLSNTVYLHNIYYLVEGLANLMKEAERRGIRV